MPRSLKVKQDCIPKVKLVLTRNGFPSQRSLAEDVGFALATVSNFLTGKPVDYTTFEELCWKLGLDWREISTLYSEIAAQDLDPQPKSTLLTGTCTKLSSVASFATSSIPVRWENLA